MKNQGNRHGNIMDIFLAKSVGTLNHTNSRVTCVLCHSLISPEGSHRDDTFPTFLVFSSFQ